MKLKQLCENSIENSTLDWNTFYPKKNGYPGGFYHPGDTNFRSSLILNNRSLTSLKGLPFNMIFGGFSVNHNKLGNGTGFQYAPKTIDGAVTAQYNELKDLKDIHLHLPNINGTLDITWNPIDSHVLGLLKISGLRLLYLSPLPSNPITEEKWKWAHIVNKYLKQPKGNERLYECQEELINEGFENYAQL